MTVSIGELTKGRFNVIFFVSFVVRSTSVVVVVVVIMVVVGVWCLVVVCCGRRGEGRTKVMTAQLNKIKTTNR